MPCARHNCFTRLRVTVNDPAFVKEQALKALPCSGVVQSGCDVQIVYGIRAPDTIWMQSGGCLSPAKRCRPWILQLPGTLTAAIFWRAFAAAVQ